MNDSPSRVPASRVASRSDDVGATRDPAFLKTARPWFERFASYFRADVTGFERLPKTGPMLVVGNHSGGQLPPDIPILLSAWWKERGEEDPIYTMFHSFVMGLPGVGSLMERGGGVEASPKAASAILRKGGILIDFPGGDHEVFRPWNKRNTIDFGGHKGVIRLALQEQVPVVPVVSVGAHESVVVLARGTSVAKWLGLDKRLRISVMPLVLGPPFGIVPGGIPTFPLPAKITTELLAPIDWSKRFGKSAANDDEVVDACYDELVTTMQAAMDRLASMRRFPIIG